MSSTDSLGSISSSASSSPVWTPLKGVLHVDQAQGASWHSRLLGADQAHAVVLGDGVRRVHGWREEAGGRVSPEGRGVWGWVDLHVSPAELRPEFSLTMGQCFNWKKRVGVADEWVGVVGEQVLAIRQTPQSTLVKVLGAVTPITSSNDKHEQGLRSMLADYFQLQSGLCSLYDQWAGADVRLQHVAPLLPGVRVVRQDPVECLFSFICSSNNNIPRITLMLQRLRTRYGTPIPLRAPPLLAPVTPAQAKKRDRTIKQEEGEEASMVSEGDETWYTFPTIATLAQAPEQELRELGLGYRAKFIVQTAQKLQELGGREWLLGLRQQSRLHVQSQLLQFCGVGRKVADCVALFSLDQKGAIPVDVHVWRIACRDYDPSLTQAKSLTPAVYERVGDLFRQRFGHCAGWAHSLLFAAELPNYRKLLPLWMQEEMDTFKQQEKEHKAVAKEHAKARRQAKAQGGRDEEETETEDEGQASVSHKTKRQKANITTTGKGKDKGALKKRTKATVKHEQHEEEKQ